jgi:hypothetical protein
VSTTKAVLTTCDLCGYGGGYAALNDFVPVGEFDFCVWCAADEPAESMSCGGHTVTFVANGSAWVCTCGNTYGGIVTTLRLRGVSLAVMDAVPNLARATASAHVQS